LLIQDGAVEATLRKVGIADEEVERPARPEASRQLRQQAISTGTRLWKVKIKLYQIGPAEQLVGKIAVKRDIFRDAMAT
jgi:hypothetical protein